MTFFWNLNYPTVELSNSCNPSFSFHVHWFKWKLTFKQPIWFATYFIHYYGKTVLALRRYTFFTLVNCWQRNVGYIFLPATDRLEGHASSVSDRVNAHVSSFTWNRIHTEQKNILKTVAFLSCQIHQFVEFKFKPTNWSSFKHNRKRASWRMALGWDLNCFSTDNKLAKLCFIMPKKFPKWKPGVLQTMSSCFVP